MKEIEKTTHSPLKRKPTDYSQRAIELHGVRQNNLKNINVHFPARKLSVITGLSGSGKSSLAFETLYAEGQRRYVESLSTYTRQFLDKMPKPKVDSVKNIPPAIALEQRNTVLNSRSTVGTQTEIYDYLRILFAKIGSTSCLDCGSPVKTSESKEILEWILTAHCGKKAAVLAPLQPPTPPKKGKKPPSLKPDTLFPLLLEQGFRRIAWKKKDVKKDAFQFLDLENWGQKDFPKISATQLQEEISDNRFFVIVDRYKLPESPKPDDRTRLSDSIGQALAVGKGKLTALNLEDQSQKDFDSHFCCQACGKVHQVPEPNLFSFNSPVGACPQCSGFGHTLDLDETLIVPDPAKTLKNGAIDPFSKPSFSEWQDDLFRFAERHNISIGKRYRDLSKKDRELLWNGDSKDKTFPGIHACFEEMARYKYKLHVRVFIRRYQSQTLCHNCQGTRLAPEARAVTIHQLSLPEILNLSVSDARAWFLKTPFLKKQREIAHEIFRQVEKRLDFLEKVGVGYLALSRLSKTLSGGEFQRINLATQLGNGLCGTLYVLDEPSIGLHAADTDRLIGVLENLRDQGNTLVVVEHDLEMMRRADWLVELGPGAGKRGGELIAQGSAATLTKTAASITGKYLSGAFHVEKKRPTRSPSRKTLKLSGCTENNLKDISLELPLERLVVVTGVSGSGKTTLVHKTLYGALSQIYETDSKPFERGHYQKLYGAEQISGVVLIDQKPIGKSSRSNPATYLKLWEDIRKIYANQTLALRRGYTPQHFSFNVDGGRCPACKGEGEITYDMHFMAEMKLPCEECDGRRFKKTVLEVNYRGKNVDQLLHTTIDEAYELLRDHPNLAIKLSILRGVGLGYLQLGQPAPTLSGGESQRLKIASLLEAREDSGRLYILDEPTTGLHQEDIKTLMSVLQDLVNGRNTVLLIEHQLDVIAQADWIIDLGPGGGDLGGHVVAEGTPTDLAKNSKSITGKMLVEKGLMAGLLSR